MFKVKTENTLTMYETYSQLTLETPEQLQLHCSSVFIATFQAISHIIMVSPLLTLGKLTTGWTFSLMKTFRQALRTL